MFSVPFRRGLQVESVGSKQRNGLVAVKLSFICLRRVDTNHEGWCICTTVCARYLLPTRFRTFAVTKNIFFHDKRGDLRAHVHNFCRHREEAV